MQVTFEKLNNLIASSSYRFNGEDSEKTYGHLLNTVFPNSEIFWRQFIVPFTNRLDDTFKDTPNSIHPRAETSKDLHDIGSFHYSIFYNFVLAHLGLNTKHPSYFESFYTHLGSICDSAEEFLMKLYFIILECKSTKSEILEKLSKEDFLKLASVWYDENYEKVYEHYLSVGKPPPIRLPRRSSVLEEYFEKSNELKEYKRLSQKIREYRNVIVHNYQIAGVLFPNGIFYVPKKEKIGKYKKWDEVFTGAADPKLFETDFVNRDDQMAHDMNAMMLVLQDLWNKPISDMNRLLLVERNEILLTKYDITFV